MSARPCHARPPGAVDPIALEPVDEVLVTTLVDNVYDALLTGDDRIRRAPFGVARAAAPQFEGGSTRSGLWPSTASRPWSRCAGGTPRPRCCSTPDCRPTAMVTNADRLGVDLTGIQGVVLSHGHFDHAGGLAGLAGRRGVRSLPMVVHPHDLDPPQAGRTRSRARGTADAEQAGAGG